MTIIYTGTVVSLFIGDTIKWDLDNERISFSSSVKTTSWAEYRVETRLWTDWNRNAVLVNEHIADCLSVGPSAGYHLEIQSSERMEAVELTGLPATEATGRMKLLSLVRIIDIESEAAASSGYGSIVRRSFSFRNSPSIVSGEHS